MIGQTNLKNNIFKLNKDTFPKSSILLGDFGCGKHLLIKEVSSFLNIDYIQLEEINKDILDEINLSPIPYIYIIDGNNLTNKDQNILLKTIEEPLNNSFIIILIDNINFLLNTIINRCQLFKFEPYTKIELTNFIPDKYRDYPNIFKICNTPGKLLKLNNINFDEYYNFSLNIVENITNATLANALTLGNKFNYKDDYDKHDINLIIDILLNISSHKYLETSQKKYLIFYEITNSYKLKLSNKIYDKKQLIFNYIIDIWEALNI